MIWYSYDTMLRNFRTPVYRCPLGDLERNSLISKNVCIALLSRRTFSGLIRSINCLFLPLLLKDGLSFVRLSIISFLGIRYIGQTRRKCTSSSTVLGQKGQNRFSFGVLGLVYLSFSMFRTWFESLNLVKDCLTISFLISRRYFFNF